MVQGPIRTCAKSLSIEEALRLVNITELNLACRQRRRLDSRSRLKDPSRTHRTKHDHHNGFPGPGPVAESPRDLRSHLSTLNRSFNLANQTST